MSAETKVILLTVICAFLHMSWGQNKCMQCLSDSRAFCVNKISYYLCMNGIPNKSKVHKCPEGKICTNSVNICEPETATTQSVCDASCNKCPADGSVYTCVSKTQYGRCIGGKVTIIDSCDSGSICSHDMLLKAEQICVTPCVVTFFGIIPTCSNDVPDTTTIAPPTTPNIDALKAKCKAGVQTTNIYYVPNDVECKTYIYCEKIGDDVEAVLMKCLSGFYDVNTNKCVSEQPNACGANPQSTTQRNI